MLPTCKQNADYVTQSYSIVCVCGLCVCIVMLMGVEGDSHGFCTIQVHTVVKGREKTYTVMIGAYHKLINSSSGRILQFLVNWAIR